MALRLEQNFAGALIDQLVRHHQLPHQIPFSFACAEQVAQKERIPQSLESGKQSSGTAGLGYP